MSGLLHANLIRIFSFYLAVMFLLSLMRRWQVYLDTISILIAVRGRWPKLIARMSQHKSALLNWATFRPVFLVLVLMIVQLVASRLIWPQAILPLGSLPDPIWQLIPFTLALIPMLIVDGYFLICVGRFNRLETELYLDKAERWSGSWRSRVIRVITIGRINPDRQVDEGVLKGLTQLGQTVSWSMWWVSIQMALRLFFGLTIWVIWALRPPQ